MTGTSQDPIIFISHRHDDKVIADALRRQLLNWGFGEDQIYQSSHPKSGPSIGKSIKRQVADALARAGLVVLIYTYERYDWQYCMWEVGLAMSPSRNTTNVIALQCFDDVPRVFADELILSINFNQIQRFVKQFHKDEGFFPGRPPYNPKIAQEASMDKSKALYEGLQEAAREVALIEQVTTPLWGFLTLRLDAKHVTRIAALDEDDAGKARGELEGHLKVIDATAKALEHFGFADPKMELAKKRRPTLQYLINKWNKRVAKTPPPSATWPDDLCGEINRVICNAHPTPSWTPFLAAGTGVHVYPVVHTARTLPNESMEFDIYIYPIPPRNAG